jgi:hypothetical protein
VDLYEPGSGLQVHDYNGGIQPSGLFWVVPLADGALRVSQDGRQATLRADDVAVLDSFQFGGPVTVPATVSFVIRWQATGSFRNRGKGRTVPPTDAGAFLGRLADARSTASFSGRQLGFRFRSDPGVSTDRGYAEMGTTRNGVFLR